MNFLFAICLYAYTMFAVNLMLKEFNKAPMTFTQVTVSESEIQFLKEAQTNPRSNYQVEVSEEFSDQEYDHEKGHLYLQKNVNLSYN